MVANRKNYPVVELPLVQRQPARRAAAANKKNHPTLKKANSSKPNLAPRKTAPRSRSERATTAEVDSKGEDDEDEEDADSEPTPKAKRVQHRVETTATEVESNDDEAAETDTGVKAIKTRTGPAVRGSETEKVSDTEANDSSSSSSNDDSAVVAKLLTPQSKKRKNVQAQGGRQRKRQGTVIAETDHELPDPRRLGSSRSPDKNRRVYGKKGRVDKGKAKAVEAEISESEGEHAGPREQALEEQDEQDLETLTVSPRRPSTVSPQLSRGHSSRAGQSESPLRERRPSKSPRSPAQTASSSRSQKNRTNASQRGSDNVRSSQANARQPMPRQKKPSAMTPAPAEESDADRILDEDDDDWNESKTTHPPRIFVHANLLAHRNVDDENLWQPDRIWVHDQFVRASKRNEICEFIESHGGEIVDKLKMAEIAVMPPWHAAGYEEVYNKVMSKGVFPVVYAWLVECAERSIEEGRPVRLSRLSYAAPRPKRADNRSKRHLRMSVEEKEQFARSYAAWLREEISRNEMLEQMQHKFFDGTRRTTIDGFDAILTEHEKEIRSLARRVNESRLRHPLSEDEDDDGFTTDAGGDAYDDFRRTRNRSNPPRAAEALRDRTASATQSNVVDYLTRLSLAYAKSETLISSIFLACGFNTEWTERVLQIVKEFELRVADLTPDEPDYLDAAEATRAEILNQDELIWSPKVDAKIRRSKEAALNDIAAELGLDIEAVKERKLHLQRIAEKGIRGWYPDEEGFRRLREEAIDEVAGSDGDGEGLASVPGSGDLEKLTML